MFMRYLGGGLGHKAFNAIVSIRDALAALGVLLSGDQDVEAEDDQAVDDEKGEHILV